MQMRPDIQIQSVLKAMTDVVLPALDPNNKLAQEQARLCMGLLSILTKQAPLQFRFDCDELERLIALSRELRESAGAGAQTQAAASALQAAAEHGADVLERARAEPGEVIDAVRALRETSGAVVSAAYQEADDAALQKLQQIVSRSSGEQLLRDRALLIHQNWEPDPKALSPIEQLIAPRR